MVTSVDGKVTGGFLYRPETEEITQYYYKRHRNYCADAFLCGRTTMQGSFTGETAPDLSPFKDAELTREDYIPYPDMPFYAVAIDTHCRLNWSDSCIHDEDPGYDNAYIIEVLCENAPDAFLAFLRSKKIAYIFAGKESLNLELAMHKLKRLFKINRLLLEGGGKTGATFAQEGLIDEYSLVVAPFIEGNSATSLIAEELSQAKLLLQSDSEKIGKSGYWVRYKTMNR